MALLCLLYLSVESTVLTNRYQKYKSVELGDQLRFWLIVVKNVHLMGSRPVRREARDGEHIAALVASS